MGRIHMLGLSFVLAACTAGAPAAKPINPGSHPSPAVASVECRLAPPLEPEVALEEVASAGIVGAETCNALHLNAAIDLIGKGKDPPGALTKSVAWNHASPPKYLADVQSRYVLDQAELARLNKNGFVVLERLTHPRYDQAYHDIHQSELPVYVTIDSVMHAVFAGHDDIMAELERKRVRPQLASMLSAMRCELPRVSAHWPKEIAEDVDVYLSVAEELLSPRKKGDRAGAIADVLRRAAGNQEVKLFGRTRIIDTSYYTPRGHYTTDLKEYFFAANWLFRTELNLVSRSCASSSPRLDPEETPREAVVALALVELAERAGALPHLANIERVWAALAGDHREDVSFHALGELRAKAGIDLATGSVEENAAKLRAAIGKGYARTVPIHYMPEGTTELPAIATMLGPRIVRDTIGLAELGHPHVPNRDTVGPFDVGYILGHDRAKTYLRETIVQYPQLAAALPKGREKLAIVPPDAYHAWLRAIRDLAEKPKGTTPSFMRTSTFDDLRMSSALAAYGQLRHTNVLLAAQVEYVSGCSIPDGWVEEAPATYSALVEYAEQTKALVAGVDPTNQSGAVAYYTELATMLRALRTIQAHELEGRALSTIEKMFLANIAEELPIVKSGYVGGKPVAKGWYFNLFPKLLAAARPASFVADYAGGAAVSYLGVSGVRVGLFVVDAGGGPRVMVGPVASSYATTTKKTEKRLDDESASALPSALKSAPWAAGYTAPDTVKAPKMVVELSTSDAGTVNVTLTAPAPLGTVVIEPLDHHHKPRRRFTVNANKVATIDVGASDFEQVRVIAHGYRAHVWFEMGRGEFGGETGASD